MSGAVDMVRIVKELPERARGRACIVLTRDYADQKRWAAELAARTGSAHVDLLDLFSSDPGLAARLREFSPETFFRFLREKGGGTHTLVVSGFEFLKAVWAAVPSHIETLAATAEFWDGPPCLVLAVQYDERLARRLFTRFPQYTFVVDQKETLKL